ncbi:MAG: AAA family ATPase [Zetaproteobacteria bacterium]|nr:MAG: AAA family ATPase [Zetaproteobacteria bacterium]
MSIIAAMEVSRSFRLAEAKNGPSVRAEGYLAHWGLATHPFEHGADDAFIYEHAQFQRYQEDIRDVLSRRRGGLVLTGPIGCGKTLLAERVLLTLDPARFEVALITFPKLPAPALLRMVAAELGAEAFDDLVRTVQAIRDRLHLLAEEGRHAVLCIDEAQTIPDDEAFEALRLLMGLQMGGRFLLSLFLVGQPELEARLARIAPLAQRVGLRLALKPLDFADTTRYILHRLKQAGASRPVLTRQAAEAVHRLTEGIPRRINNLMDRCLVEGARQGVELITQPLVREAAAHYGIA